VVPISFLAIWVTVGFVCGVAAGLGVAWLRRLYLIARYTRCQVCEGAGCYRDVTAEHMATRKL
jgi:hypothetical protein